MTPNYEKMCKWEIEKAVFLQSISVDLGMNIADYGKCAINPNSGYTYLWLEDYPFTLYMPISCELKKTDIYALWSNPEDGEEFEIKLEKNTTLNDLYYWVEKLEKERV